MLLACEWQDSPEPRFQDARLGIFPREDDVKAANRAKGERKAAAAASGQEGRKKGKKRRGIILTAHTITSQSSHHSRLAIMYREYMRRPMMGKVMTVMTMAHWIISWLREGTGKPAQMMFWEALDATVHVLVC